jgi:hypothetical protein
MSAPSSPAAAEDLDISSCLEDPDPSPATFTWADVTYPTAKYVVKNINNRFEIVKPNSDVRAVKRDGAKVVEALARGLHIELIDGVPMFARASGSAPPSTEEKYRQLEVCYIKQLTRMRLFAADLTSMAADLYAMHTNAARALFDITGKAVKEDGSLYSD